MNKLTEKFDVTKLTDEEKLEYIYILQARVLALFEHPKEKLLEKEAARKYFCMDFGSPNEQPFKKYYLEVLDKIDSRFHRLMTNDTIQMLSNLDEFIKENFRKPNRQADRENNKYAGVSTQLFYNEFIKRYYNLEELEQLNEYASMRFLLPTKTAVNKVMRSLSYEKTKGYPIMENGGDVKHGCQCYIGLLPTAEFLESIRGNRAQGLD